MVSRVTHKPARSIGTRSRRFAAMLRRVPWASVLLVVMLFALITAWLFRTDLTTYTHFGVHPERALLPVGSEGSPLGTDSLGRDFFARILAAVGVTLLAGVVPAIAGMMIGIAVGLLAGYMGGWFDRLIIRANDVLLAFPFILLAILAVAILGPSLQNAMIAVTIATVPRNIRIVRAEALSLRERDFVYAARLGGEGGLTIMARHILPNLLPIALVVTSTDVGRMMAATAGLSFLGLGVQPPEVDWGLLISDGRLYIATSPTLALLPSLLIAMVSVGFVMFGDELRHLMKGNR